MISSLLIGEANRTNWTWSNATVDTWSNNNNNNDSSWTTNEGEGGNWTQNNQGEQPIQMSARRFTQLTSLEDERIDWNTRQHGLGFRMAAADDAGRVSQLIYKDAHAPYKADDERSVHSDDDSFNSGSLTPHLSDSVTNELT